VLLTRPTVAVVVVELEAAPGLEFNARVLVFFVVRSLLTDRNPSNIIVLPLIDQV
jgi:hypothetical protein